MKSLGSGWGIAAVTVFAFWVGPSANAMDNSQAQCHTTAGGGSQCCGDNASWVAGSGPGYSEGWACMCNEGYQVEPQGDTTVCGIAPMTPGGGGGGGGGTGPGGGGGGGSHEPPENDCVEAEPVPPAGMMSKEGTWSPTSAEALRLWKQDYNAKKGPTKPKPDKDCGPKKKAACKACQGVAGAESAAINNRFASCKAEVMADATLGCKMGELADGRLVGNRTAAHNCLNQYGGWHPSCEQAIPYVDSVCHVDILPPWNTTCVESTDRWRSCMESYTRGAGATVTSFGANGSASWNTPVGIQVGLGADAKETITWAPSEGGFSKCSKERDKLRAMRDKDLAACAKKVNQTFQGGEKCYAQ